MTSYTFHLDENLKQEAFSVFKSYGLTPAQALKMILEQVVATKSILVQSDYEPNEETAQSIRDLRNGDYETVSSINELVEQIKVKQGYGS